MFRLIAAGGPLALIWAAALAAEPLSREALIGRYCAGCHSHKTKAGGFVVEGVDPHAAASRPDVWERVARRVRAGEMPPAQAPQPPAADLRALAKGLFDELDAAAERTPYAGRTVGRRLNRAEYANAVRDLLAVDLPLAAELPQDGIAAGFDNIADALAMSPLLLERYLKLSRRVAMLATGATEPSLVTEIYPAAGPQSTWQEGMPFGTRGGIRIRHYFPHDGVYELRAFLAKESLTATEGVRFFRARTKVTAGSHNVVVTFPDEFAAREGPVSDVAGPGGAALGGPLDVLGTAVRPSIDFRLDGRRVQRFDIAGMTAGEAAFDGQPGPPALARIEISGPYEPPAHSTLTPSRQRIFVCKPPPNAAEEEACAARILTAIARRAFRRDVAGAELRPYLASYTAARRTRSFEASIAAALSDILLAPDFLFRLEFDRAEPASAHPRLPAPVSGFALASRLSFFLWSSLPDDQLLDRASSGALDSGAAAIEAEARRLLADPRSEALVDNFASQWLGLRGLADTEPDKLVFPEFDAALAAAFAEETRMFVRALVRDNHSVLDLVRAGFTYLNERLARHYGIDGVTGPGFRRVSLRGNAQRGGLLSHGSVLLLTSHAARTSPVLRGKWILNNLLNSPPPAPPANVPPLEDTGKESARKLSTREKMELHRGNPGCASCHVRIDGLGFALENYDAIGRWRTQDDGNPIDPVGTLPGGKTFSGPDGLRHLLLDDPEPFVQGAVERLLVYALGRELDPRDQPAVRRIVRESAAGGYRFADLIAGVARSVPFRMKQNEAVTK